jgi:hypothetical protein
VAGPHSGDPALTRGDAVPAARPAPIAWSWSRAAFGAAAAVPAVAVTPIDVTAGLTLAFGVLPAALVGVLPARRDRVRLVPVGALIGTSIALGALVASIPVMAVITVFGVAVGAAALVSTRALLGQLLLALAVPMVGIGLSFTDAAEGLGLAGLILAGSAYVSLVSLLWPEHPAPAVSPPAPPAMLGYGIRLGLAGATAAALGFAFDVDHVGWQVAAVLLVMRPVAEMQRLRSVGRVISVALGALAAAAMVGASLAVAWWAGAVAIVLIAAAATRPSRWYVTPAFTTFIALSLLLYARPEDTAYRFGQRVGETVVGVTIAYVFGLLIPLVMGPRRTATA